MCNLNFHGFKHVGGVYKSNCLSYRETFIREHSMQLKRSWVEAVIHKKRLLDRSYMGKLYLLNRSHRLVNIARQLNCKQLCFFTNSFRRNSSLDLLKKTKGTFRKCQTKRALSMKIPHYSANSGLPKLSNQYGNGVLIVAASTRHMCSYTS